MNNLMFLLGKALGKIEFLEMIKKRQKEIGEEPIEYPDVKNEIFEIYFSNMPSQVKEELIGERVFLLDSFVEKNIREKSVKDDIEDVFEGEVPNF